MHSIFSIWKIDVTGSEKVNEKDASFGAGTVVNVPHFFGLHDIRSRHYLLDALISHSFQPSALDSHAVLAEVIAAKLIDKFVTRYPETSVHFITSKGGYIYDWLQRGEIDVAVLYDHQSDDTLIAEKLLEEELYFVYKPGHLPTNHNSISFEEVCSLPLVLPDPQHALRGQLEAHAKSMGLSLNVQSDIDSLRVLMNMAAMGTYYTVLPRRALRNEIAAGVLEVHPIVDPTPFRTIYLALPAGRPITTATRLFSDELKNAVSRLADSPL